MLEIPIPITNLEIVALAMGITFGRNIGKKLDQGIKTSNWYTTQHPIIQWIAEKTLDCTHHWWIGSLIWLYAPQLSQITTLNPQFILFFGVGLFIDDIRDFEQVTQRYNSNPK